MRLIVHKFGGSCLLNRRSFGKTLAIMKKFSQYPSIAVLSAFKGITNKLIQFMNIALDNEAEAKEFCNDLREYHVTMARDTISRKEQVDDAIQFVNRTFSYLEATIPEIFTGGLPRNVRDYVVSFGERLSSYLFYCFLRAEGINAEFFEGNELITTTSNFGNALPIMDITLRKIEEKLLPRMEAGITAVVTGYYAEDMKGDITTLGRGGTDFTATIVANTLSAHYSPAVLFWKDVDGLLTANPNIEADAKLITKVSYEEAKELAFFGSKVLHPLCLNMTMEKQIPVEIRNFNKDLDAPFTEISSYKKTAETIVKAIACIEKCKMLTVQGASLVSLPGIVASLFDILATNGINILFISLATSENNITFVVQEEDGELAKDSLEKSEFFGEKDGGQWINILVEDVSLVAIVGHGMMYQHGIAGLIFTALGEDKVNIRAIAQGSSELNISILIAPESLKAAVHAIHERFTLQGKE
ncbi:MAG: aspartate kinase [Promethearchaeota archaeon]